MTTETMPILVVDIGGSSIRLACTAGGDVRRAQTGRSFGPHDAVAAIREFAAGWPAARITIGCPGPVRDGRVVAEPVNLGPGWAGFDFEAALEMPVRLVNDAVMQALGAHRGGKMLFLGLGTGLGTTLVTDEVVVPLELAHLPYRDGLTYEDWIGDRGLRRLGAAAWRAEVARIADLLRRATVADEVVLGGGNRRLLATAPAGCRLGSDEDAFAGGIRLWRRAVRVL